MEMIKKFCYYSHHGNGVWTREDLMGKHWDHCLCHSCAKLNMEDREKNCPIANVLYRLCVLLKIVIPVWECPNFKDKEDTGDAQT